ncbi:MAG: phosphonate metabolism protein/1,5-bisphosphokinase (PRPP-forming) PhnN [Methylobacteriaceae bacterium]|nr:phosphonate metabolism protein/1,5-bisphosphokinase (PRPP-forming) PhnN [Methylobacteriaceae bacterium]MBV9246281.1 phosphonate metabolism protein/1,5-bisphosphokinase (PRPP-forming) PhnN [Methylobacteriaceae bacterium]
MSESATEATTRPRGAGSARIGPGSLFLVVGPSGAGKDTLIGCARAALADDPTYAFARRIVTRASSAWEDHESLDPAAFAACRARGEFALAWHAHGLDYALPRAIDAWIAQGLKVVCNVSRGAIGAARERYLDVRVIFIAAPPAVLAARLCRRGRDGNLAARAARGEAGFTAGDADAIIDNGGELATAAAAFLRALNAA